MTPSSPADRRPEPAPSSPDPFSRAELERYSRHLLLPEVGVEGQQRLRGSSVLIVGSGGLGAPAALYLAAAGVGRIGVVDQDSVELSNLQRQVLYDVQSVGRRKVDAAAERLSALNPEVRVVRHEERLTSANALEVIRSYDVVIDGTDNFPTRYLVNDAGVLLGKPVVFGSVYRFEGQASVFDARRGPCYRCLFPEPPPPGATPTCGEGGVLGVLPGLIGLIQATEALKLLLGEGEPLIGRLLLFDALEMRFRELTLRKSAECVVCGPNATQHGLIDYPAFCGVTDDGTSVDGYPLPETTVSELARELSGSRPPMLLDVRNPGEWAIARLPDATLLPLSELSARSGEVPRDREVVVYCKTGNRSRAATRMLIELGYPKVRNLVGGIEAWAREVDPEMPRY